MLSTSESSLAAVHSSEANRCHFTVTDSKHVTRSSMVIPAPPLLIVVNKTTNVNSKLDTNERKSNSK